MKIPFLKIKNKQISLESLHKSAISPEKDWALLSLISTAFILAVAILSAVLFFYATSEGSDFAGSTLDKAGTPSSQSIDITKFNSAIEFIKTRK